MKRSDYIQSDDFFLSLSILASLRSKDPRTINGACIVDPNTKRVLSLGYNGLPFGCSDDEYPWDNKADSDYDTKYPYCIHAERNAIYNCPLRNELKGSHMYFFGQRGYYPCPICTQSIIQHGIKKVILCFEIKDDQGIYDYENTRASRRMFESAGVEIEVLNNIDTILDSIIDKLQNLKKSIPRRR